MYKKILVPLDGSDLAECVLPHVKSIAKGCGVQKVIFLHVVEPVSTAAHWTYGHGYLNDSDIEHINSQNKLASEKYLNQLTKQAEYGAVSVKPEVVFGNAAETIADYASKNALDFIIATHGRSGISRWTWGSVAYRVLRSACVPIPMVRAPGCVPEITE